MSAYSVSKLVAVSSLLLLCLQHDQQRCCTAFVLQSASLRPTTSQQQLQQGRSTTSAVMVAPRVSHTSDPRTMRTSPRRSVHHAEMVLKSSSSRRRGQGIARWMAADPEEAVAEKDPSMPEGEGEVDLSVEGVEEVVADSDAASEAEAIVEEEEEEEKEEEVVDPMAEVKQEIKDLEKELIQQENKLADARDAILEKGQMGFLRMAAKVDNFRKSSGSGSGEYEGDAKAAVLQAMLPALTPFERAEEELKVETENEIKFNKSYQALYRQLQVTYTKLGATDFYGVVGEKFDARRHQKMSEEHSEEVAEGNVLVCLTPGLELKKNIIKKAACVVSLGTEKTEEAEEEVSAEGASADVEGEEAGKLRDAGASAGPDDAAPEDEGMPTAEGEEPAAA